MAGDSMPAPEEGKEQQPAAVTDLVLVPQPVEPDMFLDGFQQISGCTSFTHKDIGSLLKCAKLQDPLRGYDDTLCCSRSIMCGRENYYPVGASLSNPWKWTCFVNCILQCVVHTVPLALKLLKDDHIDPCPRESDKFCCYCSLKLHTDEVIKRSGCVLYPKKFVDLLNLISENFEWGQHQDAHEFLRCLLDKLGEASVPLSPPSEGSSSIVQQIFGGQLKSQLHCPECNHCSDRLEAFVDLNLEVTQMSSIMDALKSFTKIEVFENFTCDGCKSRVNMEKQFKVEQAPEVLVIQLKRFQNLGSDISKIQAMVEYQSELDLNPFMSSTEDNPQNYDLYGIVEHLGVPSNGHYICFIRPSESDWFLFDDSKVMKISKDRALESQAYLLFYVKQGSSPWFSTLLKRRKNGSSDSDEGSISCSGSDNDEQESDYSPKTSSWCKEDEIRGSDDSPAGALVTSWLRSVGSNSDSIADGKCITSNAIVQENAMKDELMKLMKDKMKKLCRSGFVGSEIENVAAGIFAEALDEIQMAVALKTSKRECTVEMLDDDGDKTGAKKRRRDEHDAAEAEEHRLGEISMAEQECGVGSKGEVQENVKDYEKGSTTHDYEYREYKYDDFNKERTSPVPVRDLVTQFESVDTDKEKNIRPSDNETLSPRKNVKLQDETEVNKRERRKKTSTNKNNDFVYYKETKSTKNPRSTSMAMSTKSIDGTPDEDMESEVIDYVNASPARKILVRIDDLDLHQDELICLTSLEIHKSTKGWLNTILLDTVITWMRHMRPDPDLRDGVKYYMERVSNADLLVRDGSVASYNWDVKMKKTGTTKGKKYISHDMIGIIVNHDNIHWYIVYVNPEERLIQVLDSMRKETRNFKKYHPELDHLLKGMETHLEVTSAYLDTTTLHDCKKSASWRDYAMNSWPVQVVKNVPQQKDGISCGLYALKNLQNWVGDKLSENFTEEDIDNFRRQLPALIINSPINLAP